MGIILITIELLSVNLNFGSTGDNTKSLPVNSETK